MADKLAECVNVDSW